LAEYAPNLPGAIEHMKVLGPPDIEATIGITGGNIFHGEITPDQMFAFRPVPGWSGYESPVERLYLCGSGAWPGGAVFGAPGRNAALAVLADVAARQPAARRPSVTTISPPPLTSSAVRPTDTRSPRPCGPWLTNVPSLSTRT